MISFFHTVNSGIIIKTDNTLLFIDVFHSGKEVGLSDTPSPIIDFMLAENNNNSCHAKVILATHSHPDHFNSSLVNMICDKDKTCLCYCPEYEKSNIVFVPVNKDLAYCDLNGIRCFALKTVHQGPQFRDVDNRSYIIKSNAGVYIFLGDTELTESVVSQLNAFGNVKAIFVNYYHLASPVLAAYIRSGVVKNIILYHLPFADDDLYHCRLCAEQVIKRYPSDVIQPEIIKSMNWFNIK